MAYWKTEWAVEEVETCEEIAWFALHGEAFDFARKSASEASRDGEGFRIIEITRYSDDRRNDVTFVQNFEGGVQIYEAD